MPLLESVQAGNMSRERHQSRHVLRGINLERQGWSFSVLCLTAACHLTTLAASKPQRRPFEWEPMMKCKNTFIQAAYFKCKFEVLMLYFSVSFVCHYIHRLHLYSARQIWFFLFDHLFDDCSFYFTDCIVHQSYIVHFYIHLFHQQSD